MVDLLMAYSKRLDLLFQLASAVERLQGGDVGKSGGARSVRSERTLRVWRVSDRLDDADVQHLISCYRGGVTVRASAEHFKISMTNVKRLMRKHHVARKGASVAAGAGDHRPHN